MSESLKNLSKQDEVKMVTEKIFLKISDLELI